MRIIFTAFLVLLVISVKAQAPEREVSGRLTDANGDAMPGVNVLIKGTAIGTSTDANGFYSLRAPVGSVIVFSFIGMTTREALVTESGLAKVKGDATPVKVKATPQKTRSPFLSGDSEKPGEGVAVLTDKTPTYFSKGSMAPIFIKGIRPSLRRKGAYEVKTNYAPGRKGLGLQFTTSAGIENVTQLPALQTQYAQGRSVGGQFQWRGAHESEQLSWGPPVRVLEFNGASYAFDQQGQLVPSGAGNGKPAKVYHPLSFFRTAFGHEQNLLVSIPGPHRSTITADIGRKRRAGVIPNSAYERSNFSVRLIDFSWYENLKMDGNITVHAAEGMLLNRGANLAHIFASVINTPVTFDNANAMSARQAVRSPQAYTLADGTSRSYAPGLADNPYGLANVLPDQEKYRRVMTSQSLKFSTGNFSVTANGSFDQQWNNVISGAPSGTSMAPQGRLTLRREKQTSVNGTITPTYRTYINGRTLTAGFSYQFNYRQSSLDRVDALGFSGDILDPARADATRSIDRTLSRSTHEALVNVQYDAEWLMVRLANRSYFSNTIPTSAYDNFFPTASVKILLNNLTYLDPVQTMNVYATVSRTLRETELVYQSNAYLSTRTQVQEYNTYYESAELFQQRDVVPEAELKFETGINMQIFYSTFFNIEYFSNTTRDFIAPAWTDNQFRLTNVATVKNHGISISSNYDNHNRSVRWGVGYRWSKYNNRVKELYSAESFIPLAGFTSVAAVLAEGQPLGAIYGSTFLRDEAGRRIIGDDGFPRLDPTLKQIGNAQPKWAMAIDGYTQWKKFRLFTVFDFRYGGEVWNGTRAMLDCNGRSLRTGEERTIGNYVFDGVNSAGKVNAVAVDFYDPAKPAEENRWMRYGTAGVAEEYIEDASWIRLAELTLSYTTQISGTRIREMKFSLTGRNLFTITPYTGVDPSSVLFGYSAGAGLDLFNAPATRTYNAQIILKI